MKAKWVIVLLLAIFLGGIGYWIYRESSKPLVGQKVEDLGRGHVPVGTEVQYNSNPPTSGPHYEEWVKTGVYAEPKDDRNLVHSLEHGYIIISYNCDQHISRWSLVGEVLAHEEGDVEPTIESSPSAQLSEKFNSESCKKLADQLKVIFMEKELKTNNKLIVLPRPSLDTTLALTAWTYLDKFDLQSPPDLSKSEQDRIKQFIDTHRGFGPEQTME